MPQETSVSRGDQRWAHFRFSVVGPLLAAPPKKGDLQGELKRLARKHWRHPITGQWTAFGASTIERWYYQALSSPQDPVGVLSRKIRNDQGTHPSSAARGNRRAVRSASGLELSASCRQPFRAG